MDTKRKQGGMEWEIRIDIYTLLCVKQTTNENRLYSTEEIQNRADIPMCVAKAENDALL